MDITITGSLYSGGVTGVYGYISNEDSVKKNGHFNLVVQNFYITDCTLKADDSIGGIVGVLNKRYQTGNNGCYSDNNQYLFGYNILEKNLDFEAYTSGKTPKYEGYICGYNEKAICISGYSRQESRQGHTMLKDLVGHCSSSDANVFGSYGYNNQNVVDGYVIFADYTDKASTVKNQDHANMYACEKDVIGYSATGSKTTESTYKIIARKDENGNSVVKSVTLDGEPKVDTSDTPVDELEAGQKSVSVTGSKTGYEDVAMSVENMDQVSSVEELTADPTQGFYLQVNGYFITGVYTGNNGYFQKENSASNAILWCFEENSDNNTYRIYTYVGDEKKYLSRQFGKGGYISIYKDEAEGKNDNPSDHWDRDVSITCSQSLFTLQLLCSNHTQYTYFGTNGSYPINQNQNDNTKFKIYKSLTAEQLRVSAFNSTTFTIGSTEISGTTSNGAAATSTQQTEYENALAGFDDTISEDDHSYEVYTITQTVTENTYNYSGNPSPYVTTNPKFSVTSGQFLTGDGVLSALYATSAFKRITDDNIDKDNKPKAYTNYSFELAEDEEDSNVIDNIKAEFSNSATEFKGYAGYETSGIKNFPLLVAEDTNRESLTRLINNYLRTLTNTDYNFADTTNSAIFDVGLYKCVFNESTKDFAVTQGACLKTTHITTSDETKYYFYMEASNVDTQVLPQFTLMDIQFKDPADTSKIAYHLFVPIYVKKVLRYDFNAEIKSGTDYYWTAYQKLGKSMTRQGLFENLGNPVTIAFEYEYDRTDTDWKDAVNGGDSLLTNYYKSLTLKNHNNNGWAANTKMVLVDANNSDKYYYLDTPPTATPTTISLYDFKDESGHHYSPVPFQDLMTVTVSQDNDGTLTPTTGNTATGATVYYNNTYYRPITDSDTNLESSAKYAVTSVTDIKKEQYYLSIFTKADDSTTNIYRYEISSPESFGSTGTGVMTSGTWIVNDWRSNRIDKNTVINLFTGKLYENNLTMNVTPRSSGTPVMSATNNYLTVDMKATVSLTSSAVSSSVGVNMLTFQNNADIYQTFLMMYDKLATVGGSHEIGIDTDANAKVGINSYYYTGGNISAALTSSNATAVADPQNKKVELAKYIELGNKQNLISLIGSSSNSYAATLQVNFDMVYAADDLSTQFPKRDTSVQEQSVIGANVIGYSKISSTVEGAANSATYDKKTDTELYYTTSESTASLKYNVEETPRNAAGLYSYLGINSVETGDDEVFVDTYAVYDTHKLTNAGNYIEFTLTLSDKGDGYVTPVVGNPMPTGTGTGTALTISNYITDLKIYGADGDDADSDDDVIFEQSAAAVSTETRVTTKGNNLYTVRVRKDLLKTQADGIYVIPIKFKVKTGNTRFNSTGLEYSNYKVTLTAATYSTISSTDYSKTSYAFDHIIYTNARVLTSVVN